MRPGTGHFACGGDGPIGASELITRLGGGVRISLFGSACCWFPHARSPCDTAGSEPGISGSPVAGCAGLKTLKFYFRQTGPVPEDGRCCLAMMGSVVAESCRSLKPSSGSRAVVAEG